MPGAPAARSEGALAARSLALQLLDRSKDWTAKPRARGRWAVDDGAATAQQ